MEASLQERVYDAAATGDAETLESLLRSSAELGEPRLLEWRDKEGRTPLIIAALKNHEQCVEMLLASKADVTCQGQDGTALHYAICKGASHTSISKLLLANAANPFVENLSGNTPFQEAMAEHMYDVVDIMRQMVRWSGIADVKVFDNARLRARRMSAKRPKNECEEEEDEIEEVVPQELMECLVVLEPVFSSTGGHYKLVAYKDERDMVGRSLQLIEQSWEWEQKEYNNVHVVSGYTKFSLTFTSPCSSDDSDNCDMLAAVLKSIKAHVQSQHDNLDASSLGLLLHSLPIAYLVGEWQGVDSRTLRAYVKKKNKRCADMLLRYGADVHSWDWRDCDTALHVAAQEVTSGKSDMSCVELLLDHGASPFIGDDDGRTPLDCFVYPRVTKGDEDDEDYKCGDGDASEADTPHQMQVLLRPFTLLEANKDTPQCSNKASPHLPPHPYSAKLMSMGALWQGKVALKVTKAGVPGSLTRCMAVVPHFARARELSYFKPAGKKLYIYKEGTDGELLFGQWGTGSVCTGDGAKCLWTENMTLVLPSKRTQHLTPDLESCMSQDEGGQLKLVLRPASRDGADLAALRTALDTPCLPPTFRRPIPFHPSFWKETPPPAHGSCVICQKAPSVAWLVHEDTAHKSLCEGCAAQCATAASTACPVCCKPVLQVLAKLP